MEAHPVVGKHRVGLGRYRIVGRDYHAHARLAQRRGERRELLERSGLGALVGGAVLKGIAGGGLWIESEPGRPDHEDGGGALRIHATMLTQAAEIIMVAWALMHTPFAKSVQALALILLPLTGGTAEPAPPPAPAAAAPAARTGTPFSWDLLLQDAKRRASQAYAPRRSNLPAGLDKLSPDQYRSIRFNPEAGIWRTEGLPFRLELLRAASNNQTAVSVSTVEDGQAHDLTATPAMFQMSADLPAQLGKVASLPLSGFRVRTRINSPKVWDEFLVFQGASYYRAVAKNLLYGLSARGLAVDTAEPMGEEFPSFTHFWIERPAAKAAAIVVYARLESESCTGAYKFTVTPGTETTTDVEMTLFPRSEMRVVGIAPLTSMFLFDETNRGRLDDYRPEVHDSDGLLIAAQGGEQVFRQLANPTTLQVSAFTTQPPQGFGLVQRSRDQADFQDFENQYERRPSAWVTPKGDWGPGAVELVEIPSGRRDQRQHRGLLAPLAAARRQQAGAVRLPAVVALRAGTAKGHGPHRGNPLGRQPWTASAACSCWTLPARARRSTACDSTSAPPPGASPAPRSSPTPPSMACASASNSTRPTSAWWNCACASCGATRPVSETWLYRWTPT